MNPPPLHRWNLSPKRAISLQRELASRIVECPLPHSPRLIAGGDAAFADEGRIIIAGWVVWDAIEKCVIEESVVRRRVSFPYVPGLLSFREAPALLAAARKLKSLPDVFMLDGHGRAHPRHFGIACHVGLWLGRPTLGCAKSRLCGTEIQPGINPGDTAPLRDADEVIGALLRTAANVKPVYVSAGQLITLADACRVVLQCATGRRLPEPTRHADQLVGQAKRKT